MACGTGKTFTALRIADSVVNDGGSILYLAPSIALVAQSRRTWLEQMNRRLAALVICSDSGAVSESNMDLAAIELSCPVTTSRRRIAAHLKGNRGITKVVFCTYQSLVRLGEAQFSDDEPEFDLAICDEAHRTCGVSSRERLRAFQAVHSDSEIRVRRRLYMTATPRLYTKRSIQRRIDQGLIVNDMSDHSVFGRELYRFGFRDAVKSERLCDYCVIVLGVPSEKIGGRMVESEIKVREISGISVKNVEVHLTRALGTALAVNGVVRDAERQINTINPLMRTIAFSKTRAVSKRFSDILGSPSIRRKVTAATKGRNGKSSLKIESVHINSRDSAHRRADEINKLRNASSEGSPRILCNVGLFSEGVDVPALDAIAFLARIIHE